MKKVFKITLILAVVLGIMTCPIQTTQLNLSREIQNEIVKVIASNYDNVNTIEFKNFVYDSKVGEYRILFNVNGYENGISFSRLDEVNHIPTYIGLNPVNVFEINKKKSLYLKTEELNNIKVYYLGDE